MRFRNKTNRTITFTTLRFSVKAGAEYEAKDEVQKKALSRSKHFELVEDSKPAKRKKQGEE